MAATATDRPLIFNTFEEIDFLEKLPDVMKSIAKKSVGEIFAYIKNYCETGLQRFLFDSIIEQAQ
jgi:hypothetical protein